MRKLFLKSILVSLFLLVTFLGIGPTKQATVWADYRQTFTLRSDAEKFNCPTDSPIKTINEITTQPGGPGHPTVTKWEVVCTTSTVKSPLGTISEPSVLNRFGTGENGIGFILQGFIGLLIAVAFILAFVFLVIGGIGFITAGGDKAKIESARGKIVWAVVGLVVVIIAFAIINFVQGFFGVKIFGTFDIPGV